jgi:hypothetical protein
MCRGQEDPGPGWKCLGPSKGDPQFRLFRQADDAGPPHARGDPGGNGKPPKDWPAIVRGFARNLTAERCRQLAGRLGLPEATLRLLPGIGFSAKALHRDQEGGCFTFAEADGAGRPCGLLCRYGGGAKLSLKGSVRGLTLIPGLLENTGPVLVVEGPSCTLAGAALGLPAVGRPSNTGGAEYLAELLRPQPADRPVHVLGEYDPKDTGEWPGLAGCKKVAADLERLLNRAVYWCLPPDKAKDVRAWFLAQGADLGNQDALHDLGRKFLEKIDGKTHREPPGATTATAAPGRPAARVRVLPPFKPFPTEALPSPLREFVTQTALAIGCDASYAALPVLAAVASAIGNQRVLRLKKSWYEVAVIWALIVGDSGTLKSPAYKAAVKPLFRVQRRLFVAYKEKRAAARRAKDDPPDGPERVLTSDCTIERLAELLQDSPRGLLLARDELAGWLGSFTRYRQAGSDLPHWLELWQAGALVVDRKSTERKNVVAERAAVSLCGSIQPGVLARVLASDFFDSGLVARLLLSMPPKVPKRWTECEVHPDTEYAYQELLEALLDLGFDQASSEDRPHVLFLSPEGKAVRTAFYDQWAEVQAEAEGEQAAAYSKLEGYAARFALLHHVVTHVGLHTPDLRPVGSRSFEAGVTLCQWFAHEAQRIYTLFTESDDERDTRRLVPKVVTSRIRRGLACLGSPAHRFAADDR